MKSVWFLDQLADVLVHGSQTSGRYGIVRMWAPAGSETPLHVHSEEYEGFCVLDGEMTIWVGDQEHVLREGDFLEAPPKVPHCLKNTGGRDLHVLVTSSPATFVDFVCDLGEPAPRRELPVLDGPPDAAHLATVAARHGIEILGPPGMRPADLARSGAA